MRTMPFCASSTVLSLIGPSSWISSARFAAARSDYARRGWQIFPLKPAEIIKELNLERPIYEQTAAYGHFGRTDIKLPWEKTDKVKELRKLAKK